MLFVFDVEQTIGFIHNKNDKYSLYFPEDFEALVSDLIKNGHEVAFVSARIKRPAIAGMLSANLRDKITILGQEALTILQNGYIGAGMQGDRQYLEQVIAANNGKKPTDNKDWGDVIIKLSESQFDVTELTTLRKHLKSNEQLMAGIERYELARNTKEKAEHRIFAINCVRFYLDVVKNKFYKKNETVLIDDAEENVELASKEGFGSIRVQTEDDLSPRADFSTVPTSQAHFERLRDVANLPKHRRTSPPAGASVSTVISKPEGQVRHEKSNVEQLEANLLKSIADLLAKISAYKSSATSDQRRQLVTEIEMNLKSALPYYKETEKFRIVTLLASDEFRKDSHAEMQQKLQSIDRLLSKPAKVLGKLQVHLTSSKLKPESGRHPLSFINYNQSYLYRRGNPFPTFDQKTGHNNLVREFIKGMLPNSIGGYKMAGYLPDEEDVRNREAMTSDQFEKFIQKKYLPRVTEDPELQNWLLYNAHMDGAVGRCWENIANLFIQKLGVSFIMDAPRAEVVAGQSQMRSPVYPATYNVYSDPKEPNAVYFTARIPFVTALIAEDVNDPMTAKVRTGEPSRYPGGQEIKAVDPVAVYEVKVKGIKNKEGKIETILEYEEFDCYHSELLPAFDAVNRSIEQRRYFDHTCMDIRDTLNNFVSAAKETSSSGFFSKAEGTEIFPAVKKRLEEFRQQILANPTKYDYELLTKELLDYVLELKQKYLANPKTENGKLLHKKIDEVVDNRMEQFKVEIPQKKP